MPQLTKERFWYYRETKMTIPNLDTIKKEEIWNLTQIKYLVKTTSKPKIKLSFFEHQNYT